MKREEERSQSEATVMKLRNSLVNPGVMCTERLSANHPVRLESHLVGRGWVMLLSAVYSGLETINSDGESRDWERETLLRTTQEGRNCWY